MYLIAIVTNNRKKNIREIQNWKIILNDAGKMIENQWMKLPQRFTNVKLHEYVIMRNHFHAILKIGVVVVAVVVAVVVVGATLVVAQNDNVAQNDKASPNNNASPNNMSPQTTTCFPKQQ